MNNFRRRSQAKKKRTVVQTYRQITSFTTKSINITNGTFRIDQTVGSTAELLITVGYKATSYLYTRYDDGTVEMSNPYTESGTVTLTEAQIVDTQQGIQVCIGKVIELGDGCEQPVYLAEVQGLDSNTFSLPEQSGGELTGTVSVNGGFDLPYVDYYSANTGTQYYINLYPQSL